MPRESVEDEELRAHIAKREGREWTRSIQVGGWLMGIGSGLVVGALAFFQVPFWLTIGVATTLTILSIASLLVVIAGRFYVQNAYTEMTAEHNAYVVDRLNSGLNFVQVTVDGISKWTRRHD